MTDVTLFAFHFHDGPHFSADSTGSLFGDATSGEAGDSRTTPGDRSETGSSGGRTEDGGVPVKVLVAVALVLAAVVAAVAWKVAGSDRPAELEALDQGESGD